MSELTPTKILPHDYPFILIDKVIDLDDKVIRARKAITVNDRFVIERYVGPAIFPISLLIESMAQTSGILLRDKAGKKDNNRSKKGGFLIGAKEVEMFRNILRGEIIMIESKIKTTFQGFFVFDCLVYVGDEQVGKGIITLFLNPK